MSDQLKLSFKWSGVAFFAASIIVLIAYLINKTSISVIDYIGLLCLIVVLIFGAYEFRDKLSGAYASAKEILKSSAFIVLIFALAFPLFTMFFVTVIDTELVHKELTTLESTLENYGMDEIQIQETLKVTKDMYRPHYIVLTRIGFYILFGGLASLLISAVMKKVKPEEKIIEEIEKTS